MTKELLCHLGFATSVQILFVSGTTSWKIPNLGNCTRTLVVKNFHCAPRPVGNLFFVLSPPLLVQCCVWKSLFNGWMMRGLVSHGFNNNIVQWSFSSFFSFPSLSPSLPFSFFPSFWCGSDNCGQDVFDQGPLSGEGLHWWDWEKRQVVFAHHARVADVFQLAPTYLHKHTHKHTHTLTHLLTHPTNANSLITHSSFFSAVH